MFFFLLFSDVHAESLQPLFASKAESTSFLKSSWNKYTENYHPNYVLDNNPNTAWVEGVEGDGVQESIVVPISSVDNIRSVQLKIRNGYQKSKSLLRANGAPKDVTVALLSRNGATVHEAKFTLTKSMGWQTIDIPISDPKQTVGLVRLTLDSVHAGTKYQDTCISDLNVLVDSDSPYKKNIEEYKRKQLRTWISERVADAKYFANKPKEYPFSQVQFNKEKLSISNADFETLHNKLTALPEGVSWDSSFYTRENKSTLEVLPDELYDLPKDIWRLSDLALFETKNKFAEKDIQVEIDTEERYIPPRKFILGNFKRATRKDGSIERLTFVTKIEECERQCYTLTKETTVVYSGNVVSKLLISSLIEDDGPDGNSKNVRLYSFQHEDEKINGFSFQLKQEFEDLEAEELEGDSYKSVMVTNVYSSRYTVSTKE